MSKKLKSEELAVSNLFDIADTLTAHQIPFWLDYATLLGAVRDQKLISSDDDIDLGMLDSEWKRLFDVFEEISLLGFKPRVRAFKVGRPIFRVVKFWRHGIAVDISLYKTIGDSAIDLHSNFDPWLSQLPVARMSWFLYQQMNLSRGLRQRLTDKNRQLSRFFSRLDVLPETSKLDLASAVRYVMGWRMYNYARIPLRYYDRFEQVLFYGKQFPVPFAPEEYLKFLYGSSWQRPDPSYRVKYSDWWMYSLSKVPFEQNHSSEEEDLG